MFRINIMRVMANTPDQENKGKDLKNTPNIEH
jgi:hypothetical protein